MDKYRIQALMQTAVLSASALLFVVNDIAAQPEVKIAFVNSVKLLSLMPGKKAADSSIIAYEKALRKNLQPLKNQYKRKLAEYNKNEKAMTKSKRLAQKKKLRSLKSHIENNQYEAHQKVIDEKEYLYRPMISKVDKAIKSIVNEKKFDFYLDASEDKLFFGKEEFNLDSQVMARLGIK